MAAGNNRFTLEGVHQRGGMVPRSSNPMPELREDNRAILGEDCIKFSRGFLDRC
jgi:hypothetical protein